MKSFSRLRNSQRHADFHVGDINAKFQCGRGNHAMKATVAQGFLDTLPISSFIPASVGEYTFVVDRSYDTFNTLTGVDEDNEPASLGKRDYPANNIGDCRFSCGAVVGTIYV